MTPDEFAERMIEPWVKVTCERLSSCYQITVETSAGKQVFFKDDLPRVGLKWVLNYRRRR